MFSPNRPGLKAIELFFGMRFERIIKELHWKKKQSLLMLSNQCGISRDCFQRHAKNMRLRVRNQKEAAIDSPFKKKGKDHWAFGLTKTNSSWAKNHSLRMMKNNPCSNPSILRKKQETTAKKYRKNPLKQEKMFKKILDKYTIEYLDQHVIDRYIIDFFIPKFNCCIEIDSTYKWGNERKRTALIRDEFLLQLGYKTIRINKAHLKNEIFILDILKAHNIIGH